MGLRVTGDQSLPVRPYYVPQPRDFEGLEGQGVSYPGGEERMARGQVQGGALQVREAHKSINPEGYPQRFRGDRESIPTAINFWIIGLGSAVCRQPASFNICT